MYEAQVRRLGPFFVVSGSLEVRSRATPLGVWAAGLRGFTDETLAGGEVHDEERLRAVFVEGVAELGLPPVADSVALGVLRYIDLLTRWNLAYNLTAVRDPLQMIRRHVLDSLTLINHISRTVIDVGSGAGLPGVPLALVCSDLATILLDANGKRIRFLRTVKRELALDDTQIVNARAEDWEPPPCPAVTIVSRALARLGDFLKMTQHWRGAEMRWVAMKGKLDRTELAELPRGFSVREVVQVRVPGCSEDRHLVVVTRAA